MSEELKKDIEAVLNLFVRPQLSSHGGGLEVLYLDENGILWIEMQGECAGCPSADETAKNLVQKELITRISHSNNPNNDLMLIDNRETTATILTN